MRYGHFIVQLNPRRCFTVDAVVDLAQEAGLFDRSPLNEDPVQEARRKAYDSLSKFAKKRLSDDPDEIQETPSGTRAPAWFGWRWQLALPPVYYHHNPEDLAQLKDLEAAWLNVAPSTHPEPSIQEPKKEETHAPAKPSWAPPKTTHPILTTAIALGLWLFPMGVLWQHERNHDPDKQMRQAEIKQALTLAEREPGLAHAVAEDLRVSFLTAKTDAARNQYYLAMSDLYQAHGIPIITEPKSEQQLGSSKHGINRLMP